jgi:hypothetical protein
MRDEANSVSCPTVSFAISCVLAVSEDKQLEDIQNSANIKKEGSAWQRMPKPGVMKFSGELPVQQLIGISPALVPHCTFIK